MSPETDTVAASSPMRARWQAAWAAVTRAIDVAQSAGALDAVECTVLRAQLNAERELLERLLA